MSFPRPSRLVLIGAAVCFIALWNVAAHFYVQRFHQRVHARPRRYCYETFLGPLNPVMVLTDEADKAELVSYYTRLLHGEESPVFRFPLRSVLFVRPVYVLEQDSQVAKILYYYTAHEQGNYLEGYVDRRTLHTLPPPDSLVRAKEKVNYQ
ncbi:hypothetical protein [Hymenobacter sp. BT491]|uniref:hypothetical protein n=1 Tax=Hymenobacter sp. BT491 TaxID=2766779 RepID=UPI0016535095|nr:hypothetical protein [Hymenobacter sp. BT491]MBC6992322.1 hypothetical protein [Hymenobacter sp. BT491]